MRGTIVEGTVVRDTGNHAYVAHFSHGITFRHTVSYNTMEDAYWWDTAPDTRTPGPETNDTVYDTAIAAKVSTVPSFRGYRLNGFNLLQGAGNVVRNSVAVGVQGNKDASGFQWPEGSGVSGHGVWDFSQGNVSHNNKVHGIFIWQNTSKDHVLSNFVAYHNGSYGINHGAYGNRYKFNNGILYGNKAGGVILRAISQGSNTPANLRNRIEFTNITIDGAGISDYGIQTAEHTFLNTNPTVFRYLTVKNYKVAAVHLSYVTRDGWDTLDFEYPNFSGNQFYLDNDILGNSIVRVQTDPRSAFQLKKYDQSGTYVAEWNARQTAIAPFTSTPPPPVPSLPPVSTPSSLVIKNGIVAQPKKPVAAPVGTPANPAANIPEMSDGQILPDGRLPGEKIGSDGTLAPDLEAEHDGHGTAHHASLISRVANPRTGMLILGLAAIVGATGWLIYKRKLRLPHIHLPSMPTNQMPDPTVIRPEKKDRD
jgi:hypothetical protein